MRQKIEGQVNTFLQLVRNHLGNGQGLIEYGLILVLISIVVIIVLGLVGGQINGLFEDISNGLST